MLARQPEGQRASVRSSLSAAAPATAEQPEEDAAGHQTDPEGRADVAARMRQLVGRVHRTSLDLLRRHRTQRQVDTDRSPVRLVGVVDVLASLGVPDLLDDRVDAELLDLVGRAVGRPLLNRASDGAGTGVVRDDGVAGGGARDLLGLEHRAVLVDHPDDGELVIHRGHADRDLRVDWERTVGHDVVHRAVSGGVNVGVHHRVGRETDGGDALLDVGNRTGLDLLRRHRPNRQVDPDRGPMRLVGVVDVRLGGGVPDLRDRRVDAELLDLVGRAVGRPLLNRTGEGAGTGVVRDDGVAGGGAGDLVGLEHRAVLGHHPDDRELVVHGRHADADLGVDRERTRRDDVVHRAVSRRVDVGVDHRVGRETDGGDALLDVGNRTGLDLLRRHRPNRQVDPDRGPMRLVGVVDVRLGGGVPDLRDRRVDAELLDLVGRAVGRPLLNRTGEGAGTGVVRDAAPVHARDLTVRTELEPVRRPRGVGIHPR